MHDPDHGLLEVHAQTYKLYKKIQTPCEAQVAQTDKRKIYSRILMCMVCVHVLYCTTVRTVLQYLILNSTVPHKFPWYSTVLYCHEDVKT